MAYYLLLIFAIYLPFQVALNPLPGIDLASIRLFSLVIGLIWLAESLRRKRLFVPANWTTSLLSSVIFLSLLSLFFADNLAWGVRKALFLLSFLPLYLVVSDLARNRKSRIGILVALASGALGTALIGLFQFSLQFVLGLDTVLNRWQGLAKVFLGTEFSQTVLDYPSWLVSVGGQDYFRAIGFFPDPHMFAMYLGLLLPIAIGLSFSSFHNKKNWHALFFAIAATAIFLAAMLTFSRGIYVGLGMGLLWTALIKRRSLSTKTKLSLAAFLILIGVALSFSPMATRLFSSFDTAEGSNAERAQNWQQAIQIIQLHPILGVGLGNYSTAIVPGVDYRNPIYAHNTYLDLAAETGILSALLFVLLLGVSIKILLKKNAGTLQLGIAASLVIFAAHSFFETGLYSVHVLPVLLILFGLASSTDSPQS
ncbi:hypothetical protein EPO05_03810 [Patescibacteria group bacterium]|nr:MAG: hypothetical protein EPO05_03810 [Patescibacteria group bacterium]